MLATLPTKRTRRVSAITAQWCMSSVTYAAVSAVAFALLGLTTNGCKAAGADTPANATPGHELLGTTPPEWQVDGWFNGPALTLRGLRGKVVLVRWWTAPDCPYCRATAPALNEFHRDHAARGLAVVGLCHHKSDDPLRATDVRKWAHDFGFEFPVAVDTGWRTLKRWWLDSGNRPFTSVTFLLDRQGRIRFIHPGGQYVKGDPAYVQLSTAINETLAEDK